MEILWCLHNRADNLEPVFRTLRLMSGGPRVVGIGERLVSPATTWLSGSAHRSALWVVGCGSREEGRGLCHYYEAYR